MGGFTASNEIISNILAGLKQHQERMLGQQQLAQEQAANEAREEQARNQLKEEHEFHTNTFDLAKKAADIDFAIKMQNVGRVSAETGINPPNSTVTPTGNNQQNITMTGPSGAPTTITVPNREGYAQQSAHIAEIMNAPALAKEIALKKEEAAEQQARDVAVQQEMTTRQLKTEAQSQTAALTLENNRIAGENKREQMRNDTDLAKARIPFETFKNLDPQVKDSIVGNYQTAVYDGKMSAGELAKDMTAKGWAGADGAIRVNVAKNGGMFLTDKQIANNAAIQPVVDLIPEMQKLTQELGNNQNWVSGLSQGVFHKVLKPEIAAHANQIMAQSATLAKAIGGETGQRIQNAMLELSQEGLQPGALKPTPYNVSIVNNVKKLTDSVIHVNNSALPPAQYAHIRSLIGIDKISDMNPDGSFAVQTPALTSPVSPGVAQTQSNPATSGVRHLMYNPNGPATPIQ